MKKHFAVLPLLLLSQACTPGAQPQSPPEPPPSAPKAELIVRNVKAFRGDGAPDAEAFAIAGGKYLAVGSEAEVLAFQGEGTVVVDGQGKRATYPYVTPHVHPTAPPAQPMPCLSAAFAASPATMQGPSLAEVRECIRTSLVESPGVPLLGVIGSRAMAELNAEQAQGRVPFDDVAPGQPVLAVGWTGHTLYANSAAQDVAQLPPTAPIPNPEWCTWERDGAGRLTGRFEEYCQLAFQRRLARAAPPGYFVALYRQLDAEAARLGYVGLDSIPVDLSFQEEQRVLAEAGVKLDWRQVCFPQGLSDSCEGAVAVKAIADGTPVDELAHQHAPYEGGFHAAPWYGRDNFSEGDMVALARRSREAGQQLLVHAVGDAAVDFVLDAVETVGGVPGWRLEHGYLATDAALQRVKSLEGTVVTEPVHTSLRPLYPAYYGAEVAERAQPLGSLLARGIRTAFATDSFGTAGDPRVQMALARFPLFITPEETVSAEQALVLLTREAERARGHNDRGTLAPGQAASFILHGTDILRGDITPPDLLSATVALTVKDGQPLWSDGSVVPEGGWRQ